MSKLLNNDIRHAIAIIIKETKWNLTSIAKEVGVSKATLSRIYTNKTDNMETQSYFQLMYFLEMELKHCDTSKIKPYFDVYFCLDTGDIFTDRDPQNPMNLAYAKIINENEHAKLNKKLDDKTLKLTEARETNKTQAKEIKRLSKIINKIGGLIGDDLLKDQINTNKKSDIKVT